MSPPRLILIRQLQLLRPRSKPTRTPALQILWTLSGATSRPRLTQPLLWIGWTTTRFQVCLSLRRLWPN